MNKKLWLLGAALVVGTTYAAVPNNTLLAMVVGDISTLDPAQAYDTASSEPIENMYESLLGYKGKSITETTPLLATAFRAAADGKSPVAPNWMPVNPSCERSRYHVPLDGRKTATSALPSPS